MMDPRTCDRDDGRMVVGVQEQGLEERRSGCKNSAVSPHVAALGQEHSI